MKTVKVLSIVVIVTGVMVMIGWVFDIPILKSILPSWVTMKFTTALSFFLGGIVLYSIAALQREKSGIAMTILPIVSLIIFFLMATLLASSFLGIHTGVEDLFVKEAEGAVKSVAPGRPSIGTMIDFLLIATSGILAMLELASLNKILYRIGIVVSVVGGVAILGYILNMSVLYYTITGWSTAMALHTAILFTILGIGLTMIGKEKKV